MSGDSKGSDDPLAVGVRSADAYESKYMQGGGTILHREKCKGPWYYQLIFAVPLLACLIPMIGALTSGAMGTAASLAAGSLLSFMLWMIFAIIRVSVSNEQLHVQFGLFGPKVAISAIEHVEAVDYDWKEFGGWGIRRSFKDGAWIYNMLGDQGRAARISYRDAKGKNHTVVVGTKNADMLADAVKQAMARQQQAGKALRIAEPGAEDRTVAELAKQEVAAAEEQEEALVAQRAAAKRK